ncbi:MAG: hypothetical protein ACREX3_05200, partial [Gammaproteobacteria bacterium]
VTERAEASRIQRQDLGTLGCGLVTDPISRTPFCINHGGCAGTCVLRGNAICVCEPGIGVPPPPPISYPLPALPLPSLPGPYPAPPLPAPAPPATITDLTVANQRAAITYEEPGQGGPHFVTIAARTGDEHVIVEATTSRPLNPGEAIVWQFDPAGSGSVDAGNPTHALVSRRAAKRARVTASLGGTSLSLTVWALFARVRRVAGPNVGSSPPAPAPPGSACGGWGNQCTFATVDFDAEVYPRALFGTPDRPAFAGAPVAPPGGNNSCGVALSNGVNNRFDMSRQIQCGVNDRAGHLAPLCVFAPRAFPGAADNAHGNDDAGTADEKNDPFVVGAIGLNGRAVPAGFMGSYDPPSLRLPHAMGAVGDAVEVRFDFIEFARVEFHRTWWLLSNREPWFVRLRLQKDVTGLWVDNNSAAG